MKQVLYKNDIYPYNVRVLLGADEEYIVKTFANLEVEDQSWEGWTDDYGGRTIFVGNRTNHRKEICFLFHSLSDMDVRTIGHDACTVFLFIVSILIWITVLKSEEMSMPPV